MTKDYPSSSSRPFLLDLYVCVCVGGGGGGYGGVTLVMWKNGNIVLGKYIWVIAQFTLHIKMSTVLLKK